MKKRNTLSEEVKHLKMETKFEKRKRLNFYKPNKSNSGGAMQFDLNAEKESIFLEMARQKDEHTFDWQNKITFKLSITDIGKILTVLEGKLKVINLYHDPSKGNYQIAEDTKNTALNVSKGDSFGFYVKISQQAKDGTVNAIPCSLSDDEAIVLVKGLEIAIQRIIGW